MSPSRDIRPGANGNMGLDAKRHAPATLRNRSAIVSVLNRILPKTGRVVEIASGSGEHVVHFAEAFPELDWQPSDFDAGARASIDAWVGEAALPNIADALTLDASSPNWPIEDAAAILCINMIHISPRSATEGLLAGSGRLLAPGAPLFLYGPFRIAGQPTAPSNEAIDRSLKARDPEWGVPNLEEVESAAKIQGFLLSETIEMPANNISVIFRKSR